MYNEKIFTVEHKGECLVCQNFIADLEFYLTYSSIKFRNYMNLDDDQQNHKVCSYIINKILDLRHDFN